MSPIYRGACSADAQRDAGHGLVRRTAVADAVGQPRISEPVGGEGGVLPERLAAIAADDDQRLGKGFVRAGLKRRQAIVNVLRGRPVEPPSMDPVAFHGRRDRRIGDVLEPPRPDIGNHLVDVAGAPVVCRRVDWFVQVAEVDTGERPILVTISEPLEVVRQHAVGQRVPIQFMRCEAAGQCEEGFRVSRSDSPQTAGAVC